MNVDLIDLIVRLLAGLFFLFFGISSSETGPPAPVPEPTAVFSDPQGETIRSFTTIRDVEVNVMESFPLQIQLRVTGEHPDGCELPVMVEQRREGNTVTVEIYRELPPDIFCPMVLQPYEGSIRLEGNFMPGDYVIRVNDFVVEVTL